VSHKIAALQLDDVLYGPGDVPYFKAAIDYLMANHEQVRAEGSLEPIRASRFMPR
jgi:hypothetical protein